MQTRTKSWFNFLINTFVIKTNIFLWFFHETLNSREPSLLWNKFVTAILKLYDSIIFDQDFTRHVPVTSNLIVYKIIDLESTCSKVWRSHYVCYAIYIRRDLFPGFRYSKRKSKYHISSIFINSLNNSNLRCDLDRWWLKGVIADQKMRAPRLRFLAMWQAMKDSFKNTAILLFFNILIKTYYL
jgi:hypothetical protein